MIFKPPTICNSLPSSTHSLSTRKRHSSNGCARHPFGCLGNPRARLICPLLGNDKRSDEKYNDNHKVHKHGKSPTRNTYPLICKGKITERGGCVPCYTTK